jgi:hypothetical protein
MNGVRKLREPGSMRACAVASVVPVALNSVTSASAPAFHSSPVPISPTAHTAALFPGVHPAATSSRTGSSRADRFSGAMSASIAWAAAAAAAASGLALALTALISAAAAAADSI